MPWKYAFLPLTPFRFLHRAILSGIGLGSACFIVARLRPIGTVFLLSRFHLNGTGHGWISLAISTLGNVLYNVCPIVSSRSKTRLDSCSLIPFQNLVSSDITLATSRTNRINPLPVRQVSVQYDATVVFPL